jgi:hypothetical protein
MSAITSQEKRSPRRDATRRPMIRPSHRLLLRPRQIPRPLQMVIKESTARRARSTARRARSTARSTARRGGINVNPFIYFKFESAVYSVCFVFFLICNM